MVVVGNEIKEKQTLVLRFRIKDDLRYLSHLETMAMLERAFTRTEIGICYSEGFNPHPRMSLPLPRSVGTESDEELLCVLVPGGEYLSTAELEEKVSAQLPRGCEVVGVELMKKRVSFRPVSAVYEYSLSGEITDEEFRHLREEWRKSQ